MEISELQKDLAAAFRWTAKLNMHEGIANHFSVCKPNSSDFYVNGSGMHFSTIKASDLILVEQDKIQKIKLSEDASEILNIALLTNSYFPKKNITKEQFLKVKSDFLIKKKDFGLIEKYLTNNEKLQNGSELIKFYVDHYLSIANLAKACALFDNTNLSIEDPYISKFKVYCLLNSKKNEEAQLYFDLLYISIGFNSIISLKEILLFFMKDFTICQPINLPIISDESLSFSR